MEAGIIATLRETMWRRTELEERRFLDIVEAIEAPVSRDLTDALFETFLPIDDYGTQESVVGKLTLVDISIYFDALSENIQDIIERAPDWAEDILLRAAIDQSDMLSNAILKNKRYIAERVVAFLKNVLIEEPEIKQVVSKVEEKLRAL